MEKLQIFGNADFEQVVQLGGSLVTVRLTWLPVKGVYLFGLATAAGVPVVSGVVVVPFAPLLSLSALRRVPGLSGNLFCFPEDKTALSEDVTFESVQAGRYGIYFVSAEEAKAGA